MSNASILNLLQTYHDDIVERIAASVTLIENEGLSSLSTLAARRWQMVRLLREYQIFKHSRIFDPAIAKGSSSEIAAAYKMKVNCIAIGDEFAAYVRHWSSGVIATNWEDYRFAMIEMSTSLMAHVKTERRDIDILLSSTPSPPHSSDVASGRQDKLVKTATYEASRQPIWKQVPAVGVHVQLNGSQCSDPDAVTRIQFPCSVFLPLVQGRQHLASRALSREG